MEIQLWGGQVLRDAEAAPRSMTHQTARPEIGHDETVSRKLWLKRLAERSCLATRRGDTGYAEAHEVFALQRVVSCGRADLWWRTKLDFGSGEPFDDLHGPATLGAAIKIGGVFDGGSSFFGRRFLCRTQQLEAKGQGRGAASAGQETEVPDAHETLRKQMQQEAAQEFIVRQTGELLLVGMSRIAPAKGHLAIGKGHQAMVGDSHAMGVAAQIVQHIFGTAEGTFQVHHPVLSKQWPQPGREDLGFGEELEVFGKAELAILKGLAESRDKLATKNLAENRFGQEVVVP